MPSNYKIINLMGLAGKDDEEAVSGSLPPPCLKKEMMIMEGSDDEKEDYSMEEEEEEEEEEEDSEEYSSGTCTSSSSSSSSPPPDSSTPDSPLFKLSDLMAQLPIKRGLSRYYEGKSESFTSLASVKSVEDLMKNQKYKLKMKMKCCRSYGCFSPKATISKKTSSRLTTCCVFNSLGSSRKTVPGL